MAHRIQGRSSGGAGSTSPRRPSRGRQWAVLLSVVLAGLGSACRKGTESGRPDLGDLPLPAATRGYILISIDTLRADHLGCYGYSRPTTPFLDSLAKRGTLFEEAYSQYPSTLVSHMSMLTGLHPREHGVFPPNAVLSPEVELLPEVFQRNGFRTAGHTEGGFVSGRFGFRRGFDQFVSHERNRHRQLEQTFQRGVSFLEGLKPDDRFFLFLHTYAVHTPYDAPRQFVEPFWKGEAPAGSFPPSGPELTRRNLSGERPPAPVLEWLEALYDAGIRQTDEVVRRFFADLDRLGLSDDVTVIVTSDHGEELLDHGLFNHTQLYRETLRVPLLVVHPSQRRAVRHGGVVRLIDLAPTLYDLARLKPAGKPSGVSLARLVGRALPPIPGTALADAGDGMRAIYRNGSDGEPTLEGKGAKEGKPGLQSLLLFDPPPANWLPRRVAFDARGGDLELEARAPEERRRLTVRLGGKVLAEAVLSEEWAPLRLHLDAPARLVLEADGCTIPSSATKREPQCDAFELRGVRLTRLELYDIAADPGQRNDLSRTRAKDTRRLLSELMAFRPAAVGKVTTPPLDPELEESLRALGYIQ